MTLFADDQLKSVVDQAVREADLPAGHTNAIIGAVDTTGAQVVVTAKFGKGQNWAITGAARHDWATHDNAVGGKVIYSW